VTSFANVILSLFTAATNNYWTIYEQDKMSTVCSELLIKFNLLKFDKNASITF